MRLRSGERRLLLILGDLLAAGFGAGLALALWGRFDFLGPTLEFVQARAGWFVFLPFLWPLFMVNLYDIHRASSWRDTVSGVVLAAGLAGTFYLGLYFLQEGSLARRGVLYFLGLTPVLTVAWRLLYIRIFTAPMFLRRVLIAGAGEGGKTLLAVYQELSPKPFYLVGLLDDDRAKQGKTISGARVLGDSENLLDLIREHAISEVVVAIQGPMNGAMFQALLDAQQLGVDIVRMPVLYEDLLGRVPIRHLESDWLLRSFVDEVRVSAVYLVIKRMVDVAGGLAGLLVLLVFLPWAALAVYFDSGPPIFYRQSRMGQAGRVFYLLKLRTMRQDAEANGTAQWASDTDPRTTRVGRILRRTHLDEFPQFWSVLRGDMSLVGPRPERPELVDRLEKKIPFYRARLLVRPGITGWAQVNYGKGASMAGSAEKLEFDLYYIKHRNLWLDLWIVLRTLGSVLRFRGV